MSKIPTQFADILTPEAKAFLTTRNSSVFEPGAGGYAKINAITPHYSTLFFNTINDVVGPHLRNVLHKMPNSPKKMHDYKFLWDSAPIPWQSHTCYMDFADIKGNREELPDLSPLKSIAYTQVKESGLFDIFQSESWFEWFHNFIGADADQFEDQNKSIQFSKYTQGDNIGLHNDYYGTTKKVKWFLDVHISFVNKWVDHQYMLFGKDTLNNEVSVAANGSIGIYRLPLWHFVTPLIGKVGHENEAARWLIILDRYYKKDAMV